ncbi:hypothetical protein D3C75_1003380 [compost metagenome]
MLRLRGQLPEPHLDPVAEAHSLDIRIHTGMIHFLGQRHLVGAAAGNKLVIFPQLIGELLQLVIIPHPRHRIQHKEAVVQKMRVNLGLELLQLRLLGQDLLLVHLIDERIQLFHHAVEPGVNILEFVILLVADNNAEIAVFDFAESLGQLDQRLVDIFIDVERIRNNYYQRNNRQD